MTHSQKNALTESLDCCTSVKTRTMSVCVPHTCSISVRTRIAKAYSTYVPTNTQAKAHIVIVVWRNKLNIPPLLIKSPEHILMYICSNIQPPTNR